MYFYLIYLIFPIINTFVIVKIHRNSLFNSSSSCSFIRNESLLNDVSIQSCIRECVNEYDCQTAIFFKSNKICSMFKEKCQSGSIQTFTNILTSVICYRKNHNSISTCSPTTISNEINEESTSISNMIITTETRIVAPMTSSTLTPNYICNITTCRSIIAYYISLSWAYSTTSFGECIGCSYASWPNFPSDWSDLWNIQDFVIWSSFGQDCQGNPKSGNLTTCQIFCLQDETCVGFSREKNILDNDSTGQCYLKNNIQLNEAFNDTTWHTVVFNTTS